MITFGIFLIIELIVFLLVFVLAGIWATKNANIAETLPIFYLLNWCIKIFLTMLPSLASIWAITIIFDKVILSVGLNILLVIPSILVAATPLRIVYPYCYSGYLVSCSLYDFTSTGINNNFELFPLMPIAIFILAFAILVAIIQFGKKEMR
ncbi:hypothetical protein [Anaerococcus porci]|uniref:Uncharacterized protein n=1 Tax=Anaerococcus porci TaxID=2652269 RepID=A0A6N7VEW0_9FIRM|nr:hypothetical protein [Anaerococcus porci]MDY3005766.1 hypothetical protein [Anaerococcus porci]MSS77970.1 hypothetical protein [Anaerococcus porci]